MGLLRSVHLFPSLDAYILRMHADKLANVLDSLVSFARKVELLKREDPHAWGWHFSKEVFIQSRHWPQLARHVLNLLKLLGHPDPDDSESTRDDNCTLPSPDVWPNQEALRHAMRRTALIYRAHARPSAGCPRLPPM